MSLHSNHHPAELFSWNSSQRAPLRYTKAIWIIRNTIAPKRGRLVLTRKLGRRTIQLKAVFLIKIMFRMHISSLLYLIRIGSQENSRGSHFRRDPTENLLKEIGVRNLYRVLRLCLWSKRARRKGRKLCLVQNRKERYQEMEVVKHWNQGNR